MPPFSNIRCVRLVWPFETMFTAYSMRVFKHNLLSMRHYLQLIAGLDIDVLYPILMVMNSTVLLVS